MTCLWGNIPERFHAATSLLREELYNAFVSFPPLTFPLGFQQEKGETMPRIDTIVSPVVVVAVAEDMARCMVPVRQDIIDAHAMVLTRLALPGTWWTGAERVAIAAEARAARHCHVCAERKAALSPSMVTDPHQTSPAHAGVLPDEIVDIVHFSIMDAARMTPDRIATVFAADLTEAHFVEALGIAASQRSMDQTCLGLGVPLHALPIPEPGDPTRILPETRTGEAFVAMMAADIPAPPNDDLWGDVTAYGLQALSLVPDAVRDLLVLSGAQYITMDKAFDFSQGRTLTRAQMEMLAGRVSAINDCFY